MNAVTHSFQEQQFVNDFFVLNTARPYAHVSPLPLKWDNVDLFFIKNYENSMGLAIIFKEAIALMDTIYMEHLNARATKNK